MRLSRWDAADVAYEALLGELGVDERTVTTDIVLAPRQIESEAAFVRDLNRHLHTSKDLLQFFVLSGGDRPTQYGLALTLGRSPVWDKDPVTLDVEIHSRLIAWWLTYAWRSRQLAAAAATLADGEQSVPAATCARSLLETAAAFWVDAQKFAAIWKEAKAAGRPSLSHESLGFRSRFIDLLNEVQFGAKFSEHVPETQAVFGRHHRSNVLSAIQKLAKRHPGSVQDDYEWLCNTAHPSLGTALVFSGPPLVHDSRTHLQRWFAGVPLEIDGPGFDDALFIERSIPSATARATVVALEVVTATLDAVLHVLDDIALTTQAPTYADFSYWRALKAGERNALCACRSGRKTKQCGHHWSDPAPTVPTTFLPA